MRHLQPLLDDSMTKLRNMLPVALVVHDEPCVIRQCAILLKDTKESIATDFVNMLTFSAAVPHSVAATGAVSG